MLRRCVSSQVISKYNWSPSRDQTNKKTESYLQNARKYSSISQVFLQHALLTRQLLESQSWSNTWLSLQFSARMLAGHGSDQGPYVSSCQASNTWAFLLRISILFPRPHFSLPVGNWIMLWWILVIQPHILLSLSFHENIKSAKQSPMGKKGKQWLEDEIWKEVVVLTSWLEGSAERKEKLSGRKGQRKMVCICVHTGRYRFTRN